MDEPKFLELLVARVPDARAIIEEHLADNGELLLHVLMGDLTGLAWACQERGVSRAVEALLGVLDQALRNGDDRVENAVAVSFVETIGPWDPGVADFIATWPAGLRAQAERQRRA